MVLVVLAVSGSTTSPARREHDLESDTILAMLIKVGLVREIMAVKRALGGLGVVQAVEADCALSQILLFGLAEASPLRLVRVRLAWVTDSVRSSVIASRDHSESRGKGGNIISVEKVVPNRKGQNWTQDKRRHIVNHLRKHATNLRNNLKLASRGIFKVDAWGPVSRLVLGDTTRCAVSGQEV